MQWSFSLFPCDRFLCAPQNCTFSTQLSGPLRSLNVHSLARGLGARGPSKKTNTRGLSREWGFLRLPLVAWTGAMHLGGWLSDATLANLNPPDEPAVCILYTKLIWHQFRRSEFRFSNPLFTQEVSLRWSP